ncbi:MAG TPA: hypothetical protein DER33_02095 [Syntrophomonas sp.]|nr:hypothetical protein [Syntrophomonas sp.]
MGPIMAIKTNDRPDHAPDVQEILTSYGCNIKTRVGFHDVSEDQCSMDGLIMLQLFGKEKDIQALFDELDTVEGVKVKFIDL